jgi:hypothetical protein
MNAEEIRQRQLDQLKEAAKIFLRPMERLPFPVVVEAMTGKEVLPVTGRPQDMALLKALASACIQAVVASTKSPTTANRPNEVSAQIEDLLSEKLTAASLRVERPQAASSHSPGGYPDLLVWQDREPTYLEVKVSREENIDQGSARNFFYQPTSRSKILHSGRHLLAGFAIKEIGEKQWVLKAWKLCDLWHLRVKLKP